MTTELSKLYQELRHANEGLAQMQAPGAGYEDSPEQLERDVRNQCDAIAVIERKIARLEKVEA